MCGVDDMQLKEKTYYRTRDGRKAYVSGSLADACNEVRFFGILGDAPLIWRADGISTIIDKLDLISEWRETLKIEALDGLMGCTEIKGDQVPTFDTYLMLHNKVADLITALNAQEERIAKLEGRDGN